jgi:hypothetical protein
LGHLHADGSGILSRIDGALNFTDGLLATSPTYAKVNPLVKDKIEQIKKLNKNYVAHEYFNRDWHPMHFNEMVQWLEPAKLAFACSATYLDHIESLNLSTEQIKFLNEIKDVTFRETARDFMVNQQFRRDYWVKGARRPTELEQTESIRKLKFILVANRASISLTINGPLGEANLNKEIYNPLLDLLADYKVRSFEHIESALAKYGLDFAKLVQALLVLTGTTTIACVQDEQVITKAKRQTDKLNSYFLNKSRGSNELGYLASPVTGGAIAVGRFQQLFVLAIQKGLKKPEDWAAFVDGILSAQGQKIVKEGKALETQDEMLAELNNMANDFSAKQLPILKALLII